MPPLLTPPPIRCSINTIHFVNHISIRQYHSLSAQFFGTSIFFGFSLLLHSFIISFQSFIVLVRPTVKLKHRQLHITLMSLDDPPTSVSSPNSTSSNSQHHRDDEMLEKNLTDTAASSDFTNDSGSDAECACGRVLSPGWSCSSCRRGCPICQRSLTADPSDYCDRCYSMCDIHGLYRNNPLESVTPCPQCHPPSTKASS